jgi:asparagine synthase (glutamine-hydrolysing)
VCGICGIYHPDRPVDEELLRAMNGTLAHRGPDGEGIFIEGNVGLAMRRLAIIDLNTGDQPIFNEDGSLVIIFNGEIFNYRELRAELLARGHTLKTAGDTEAIVHLYEEYGPTCVEKLNGMFAFALWDTRQATLLLARDQLGIKPMHYAQLHDGTIIFASEIKALLAHPALLRDLDPVAIQQYFAQRYVPSPRSIYQAVRKLPPAHRLIIRGDTISTEKYWDFAYPELDPKSQIPNFKSGQAEHEWKTELRELLEDTVERQMLADVPLGAFLSGGIDSTIIVGLMAQRTRQPVKTYSVGFDWKVAAYYDESPHARAAAQRFGTDHHEVVMQADALDLWPRLAAQFDEPMADPAAIPTYLISKFARESVKVVLTGEGADELFAGYGWYRWAHRRMPAPLVSQIAQSVMDGRRGKRTIMAAFAPSFEEFYFENVLCSAFQNRERARLFSADLKQRVGPHTLCEEYAAKIERSRNYDPQSRMQFLDTTIWLEGDPLTKVDRMSMAASLEARVPFLDYRVVEMAARIPPELKLHNGISKAILREVFADLLPPKIAMRPKHAFDIPIGLWLRQNLRPLVEGLAQHPSIGQSGLFDSAYVERLARAHLAGRDHAAQLWALLTWSLWWERK